MSSKIVLALCLLVVVLLSAGSMSQTQPRQYRTVLQVTAEAPAEWEAILGNIDNLRKALDAQNTQVEVVAHGKGIGLVLNTNQDLAERMKRLSQEGVVFAACQNTLAKKHLTEKDLLPFATTVDAGVAQVVRRQAEGWSYIRYGN